MGQFRIIFRQFRGKLYNIMKIFKNKFVMLINNKNKNGEKRDY